MNVGQMECIFYCLLLLNICFFMGRFLLRHAKKALSKNTAEEWLRKRGMEIMLEEDNKKQDKEDKERFLPKEEIQIWIPNNNKKQSRLD